ncbi:MAG: hypothetical protein WAT67_14575 [Candidatus Contendobacter sp.]
MQITSIVSGKSGFPADWRPAFTDQRLQRKRPPEIIFQEGAPATAGATGTRLMALLA